jgi:hypothetical protein
MPGETDRAGNPGERLPGNPALNKAVQQPLVTAGGLYQLVGLF